MTKKFSYMIFAAEKLKHLRKCVIMKQITFSALVLVLFISLTGFAFASTPAKVKAKNFNKELVEQNLLIGINSENTGLRASAAFVAGEIKSDHLVIPLMKLFREEKNDKVRISAALALLKIGDARGIKLIEFASRFDDCCQVKDLCKKFHAFHLQHPDN